MKAVVLAAGKGSRMLAAGPKCCQKVLGVAMIRRVVDNLKAAGLNDIIVVVGYKADEVIALLKDEVTYVYQPHQTGTADAVYRAKELITDDVLITLGDMPFIKAETFKKAATQYKNSDCDMLVGTYINSDSDLPYGRIIRKKGNIVRIIEEKDCTVEQKNIKELKISLYVSSKEKLFDAIDEIDNNNTQKEYYLTDVVEKYSLKGYKIESLQIDSRLEVQGINTIDELARVEKELVKRF